MNGLPSSILEFLLLHVHSHCTSQDSGKNALLFSKLQLTRCGDTASSTLRPRQLLVLLALRLLQECIVAPSSCIYGDSSGPPNSAFVSTHGWEHKLSVHKSNFLFSSTGQTENVVLIVPLSNSRDAVRHFLFRDVVLLWAKMLQVPEEDAQRVVQAAEDSRLP